MRKILAVGSIGVVVVLVLSSFSIIVNAQTIKSSEILSHFFEIIRNKTNNENLEQGGIIETIQLLIFAFLVMMSLFLKGYLFY
ncbi:MAG: hypothetical protein V1726_04315 [Methanobacteriota archaeon]